VSSRIKENRVKLDIRKKILLDLLVVPSTVIPFTAGISLLLISVVVGSTAAFAGFCSLLVSLGSVFTNLIFNLSKITDKVINDIESEKSRLHDIEVLKLDRNLVLDNDPRDQTALRNLRIIYKSFKDDLRNGKVKNAPKSMVSQIDDLYFSVIHHLQNQHELWETSTKVTGELRKNIISQRETLILEIEKSVQNLSAVTAEVRALGIKSNVGELTKLQERLDSQLNVAKEVEKMMSEMNQDDLSRFKEYETQ
jgi:hypothetical protein